MLILCIFNYKYKPAFFPRRECITFKSFEHPKIDGLEGFSLPQPIMFRENTAIRWASKLIVSQKKCTSDFS